MSRGKIPHDKKISKLGEDQLFISQSNYSGAAPCCIETARRRLNGVPYHDGPNGARQYHLAAALPTLWPREIGAGAVVRMAESATVPEDVLYVGDVLDMARDYIDWLDSPARARLAVIQNSFVVALANSAVCAPPVVENLESLRTLIAVQPDVMAHVLTGAPAPELGAMAPAFGIVNNTIFNMKEAA